MPSDSDWENVSLGQLRAWDWAPESRQCSENGQPISLTLHGLKDKNHFRANLAKAIERGLAKRDALAALTTAPAKLTGVSDQRHHRNGKLQILSWSRVTISTPRPRSEACGSRASGIRSNPKTAWIDKEGPGQKREKKKKDEPEEDKLIALSRSRRTRFSSRKQNCPRAKCHNLDQQQTRHPEEKRPVNRRRKISRSARYHCSRRGTCHQRQGARHAGPIDAHNHSMILGMVTRAHFLLCHGLDR